MPAINWEAILRWSKTNCYSTSKGLCAGHVKKAFMAGGFTYVSGNGFLNQPFCKQNGFELIGDFIPEDGQPRAHNGKPMQWPKGYTQQQFDICLIEHGQYGHMVYAMGNDIGSWASDYFQSSIGGPYCYPSGGVKRVQFWRHSSLLNGATPISISEGGSSVDSGSSSWGGSSFSAAGGRNAVTTGKPFEPNPESVEAKRINSMNDNTPKKDTYGVTLGMHLTQQ